MTFTLRPEVDLVKWDVWWFGDDESRLVAVFFNRAEAQDYKEWRNNEAEIPGRPAQLR